jgi:hypothetical protein
MMPDVTEPLPRRFLRMNEPLVGMVFFSPEIAEAYGSLGVDPVEGYFCSRSAAFGRASPELVIATFYNFNPVLVRRAIEGGWAKTTPEALSEARFAAAGKALRRVLANEDGSAPDVSRVTELAWRAVAAAPPQGRPLYAAHLAQPRRDDAFEALWQAGNLLREFRGDGHIAVLLAHGVGPVDALVLHAPLLGVELDRLIQMRQWDQPAVEASLARLREQGLIEGEGFTEAGAELRERMEAETDELASVPFDALGDDATELVEGMRTLAKLIVARKGVRNPLRSLD